MTPHDWSKAQSFTMHMTELDWLKGHMTNLKGSLASD